MNFILAIIVLTIVSYSIGVPTTTIEETIEIPLLISAGIISWR